MRPNYSRELSSETTTMVAHDLRGPLAALKALARRPDPLGHDKEVLFLVVDRIEGITRGLLKAGSPGLYPRSMDPVFEGVSVQELQTIVQSLVHEKAVQYSQQPQVQISILASMNLENQAERKVRCLARDVQRILSNLIDNAVESFEEGGSIRIGIEVRLAHCVVTVSDNGPGVSGTLLPMLGWRKVVSEKQGGHGIGMFYAGELVRSWGGRLLVQSEGGTCVRMVLAPM